MTGYQRKDMLDAIYPDSEAEALLVIVEKRYEAMLRAVHSLVADALGLDPVEAFRLDDEATRAILQHAAERVVMIDTTTRDALRKLLQEGQRLGLSNWELANGTADGSFPGVEGLFKTTWRGRADLLVRTELAESQRISAINRYAASGVVDRVRVVDGDGDDVCARRNGQVVPLDRAPELAHPGCRLTLIPIVRGTE